jgi:hypothetical protein
MPGENKNWLAVGRVSTHWWKCDHCQQFGLIASGDDAPARKHATDNTHRVLITELYTEIIEGVAVLWRQQYRVICAGRRTRRSCKRTWKTGM